MNAGRLTTFGSDAVLLRSVSVRSDLAADVVAGRFTTTLPKRPTIGPPNLFGYWPTLEGWAGADSIGGYVVRELDGRRQPRLVAHTAFTGTVAPTDRGSLVTVEIAHIGARRLAIWRVALWVVGLALLAIAVIGSWPPHATTLVPALWVAFIFVGAGEIPYRLTASSARAESLLLEQWIRAESGTAAVEVSGALSAG